MNRTALNRHTRRAKPHGERADQLIARLTTPCAMGPSTRPIRTTQVLPTVPMLVPGMRPAVTA